MASAPIILVPGFWLGAWAWDDAVPPLQADGHDVTAITLPGLQSFYEDRSVIGLSDHVDAICEAVTAAGAPAVLAVHSGAGASGYAASDRIPEQWGGAHCVAAGGARPSPPGPEGSRPPHVLSSHRGKYRATAWSR